MGARFAFCAAKIGGNLRRVHHVIHPLMQVHQRIQTVLNGYHQVDLMRLKYRLQ